MFLQQASPSASADPPAHLSRRDLNDLINDPLYLDAFVHSLPSAQEMQRQEEDLMASNETSARANLSLRNDLFALRDQVKRSHFEMLVQSQQVTETRRQYTSQLKVGNQFVVPAEIC